MSTATLFDRQYSIGKILCVGRNYADHAKEMNAEIPTTPVLFLKPSSAVVGNGEEIVVPPVSGELHHEVEMTVLIGMKGKNISESEALSYVAGYGVGLDMTLRDIQAEAKKKGLPWTLAKGFDTSAPLSPFVPASMIRDPHQLDIVLRVNGTVRQQSNTRYFIFSLQKLIHYISQFFTLEPGDVIFTGTPEGVGAVKSGDLLEASLSEPGGPTLASLKVRVR